MKEPATSDLILEVARGFILGSIQRVKGTELTCWANGDMVVSDSREETLKATLVGVLFLSRPFATRGAEVKSAFSRETSADLTHNYLPLLLAFA